jgi:hypothetical protein
MLFHDFLSAYSKALEIEDTCSSSQRTMRICMSSVLELYSYNFKCVIKINRRLNSGNACYHLVQNLLSSQLLSKNLQIRI